MVSVKRVSVSVDPDEIFPAWMDRAACKGKDVDLFFPQREEMDKLAAARKICIACPVREECLAYALHFKIRYGVWGGLGYKGRLRKDEIRRIMRKA